MAVVTKETQGLDDKPSNSLFSTGKCLKSIVAKAEVASGDSATSTFVLAKGLSLDDIVVGIRLPKGSPAITGMTGNDIGLGYIDEDGDIVEVEKDVFVDGKTFASAIAYSDDICESSTTDTIGESLATEISTENAKSNYVIYLTSGGTTSAAGNLDFVIDIATSA